MKDATIIISTISVGVGLIYLVITILPFLIAVAGIVLIWWMICMCLSGGFECASEDTLAKGPSLFVHAPEYLKPGAIYGLAV